MILVLEICLGFMCLDDHEACRSCWRWTLMSWCLQMQVLVREMNVCVWFWCILMCVYVVRDKMQKHFS